MPSKRILIAGGAGFIGSALLNALAVAHPDAELWATVHSRDPAPKVPRVRYMECDLTCRAGWDAALLSRPDLVYMAAGKSGGSGLDPLHFVTDNALMHLHMFRSCAQHGVGRIIAMSSTTGYPDTGAPMREDDYFEGELHPAYFNPGHTRRFIERLGAMYPQIATTFIRVSGVYGPGADFDPASSHVIEATIRKVAERQDPIVLWGDGHAWRDALYIDDLAAALVQCAAWPAGAYNFASGTGMTVNNMLHTLLAHAGHEPRVERDLSRPQMIAARRLDWTRAESFGWTPTVAMREGLIRTLDWFEAQRG